MAKISNEIIHALYAAAKKIHQGEMTHKDGIDVLVDEYGINRNSASDYVYNYICMIEGKRFSRTSNAYATEYYLQQIYADGGRAALLNALSALCQHLDYYEEVGGVAAPTRRAIYERFLRLAEIDDAASDFPDEVSNIEALLEGKSKKVYVNVYERNPVARQKCIDYYGRSCTICFFNFKDFYGDIGASFIHVHHLIELSSIGNEYSVDPISDLRPVCPNCHAMLHKRNPAYSIEELQNILKKK